MVISQTMRLTAHKPLPYHVEDLWCDLGPMGLLVWFIDGYCYWVGTYLNPLPTTTTPPPAHLPLIIYILCATCDLSKVSNPIGC